MKLDYLRRYAIARALSEPTTLARAVERHAAVPAQTVTELADLADRPYKRLVSAPEPVEAGCNPGG